MMTDEHGFNKHVMLAAFADSCSAIWCLGQFCDYFALVQRFWGTDTVSYALPASAILSSLSYHLLTIIISTII